LNIGVNGGLCMAKTITVRVDEATYDKIKTVADSERRTISNFIEYATMAYVENSCFVADEEMNEITNDRALINSLNESLKDIKEGKYRIVE
jgi:hypothetical protein